MQTVRSIKSQHAHRERSPDLNRVFHSSHWTASTCESQIVQEHIPHVIIACTIVRSFDAYLVATTAQHAALTIVDVVATSVVGSGANHAKEDDCEPVADGAHHRACRPRHTFA